MLVFVSFFIANVIFSVYPYLNCYSCFFLKRELNINRPRSIYSINEHGITDKNLAFIPFLIDETTSIAEA